MAEAKTIALSRRCPTRAFGHDGRLKAFGHDEGTTRRRKSTPRPRLEIDLLSYQSRASVNED